MHDSFCVLKSISKVYTNNKNTHTPYGVWVFLASMRDLNQSKADVRWTSACRRLDRGNTIIYSNPSISFIANGISKVYTNNKKTTLRGGFLIGEMRWGIWTDLNATVRWTVARSRLDGNDTIIYSNPSISFVANGISKVYTNNKKPPYGVVFLLAKWDERFDHF